MLYRARQILAGLFFFHACPRPSGPELLAGARPTLLMALLLSVLSPPAAAQVPRPELSVVTPSPQERPTDPLGRGTPRGTIIAFARAADRQDFVSAARYMQVTESQRRDTATLARDLKALMERYFSESLLSISDSPGGALDDGLPLDRERVGPLVIGDRKIDISLVHVTDPQAGPIWLISSETLTQMPFFHGVVEKTWIERRIPALGNRRVFGISLTHWIALGASLLLPFILLALLSRVSIVLSRLIFHSPAHRRGLDALYARLRWPVITSLALATHLASLSHLGLPVTFRLVYARVGLLAIVISFAWLLRQLLTLGFDRARGMLRGKDRTSHQSLMLLGERLLKALVALLAVFALLTILGLDTKTALAGLGIGGVALALGAQKTVENLLGGVLLLSDRALAVGDQCRISNRLGQVEDITLRSVRLRTPDQTLVSVPAGVLAQAGIENFATRTKILIQTTLRLRYGTRTDEIRQILDSIRALLDKDQRIEIGTSWIRLVDFSERAIELELFAYVLTPDPLEFMAVREDLLLAIGDIVQASGTGFAQPIYMDGDVPGPVSRTLPEQRQGSLEGALRRPVGG